MRQLLVIAANDLRLLFIDKSIWVNLVIVPVILSLAIGAALGGIGGSDPNRPLNLDVIDNDQSAASRALLDEIVRAQPRVRLCGLGGETQPEACNLGAEVLARAQAQARLEAQEATAFLEIPEGYGASVSAGESVELLYRTREAVTQESLRQSAVTTAAQRAGGAVNAQRIADTLLTEMTWVPFDDAADRAQFLDAVRSRAQDNLANDLVVVEATSGAAPTSSVHEGFAQSVPGMASMYVLFTVLPMGAAFLRDRRQWTIQRALTMPVSRWQLMGGKMLAYFAVGFLQSTIVLGFGYLMGLRYGSSPLALLLVMFAYTLAVTSLALLVTALVRTEAQAESATLLIALTMAPLGGAWWPLEIVPRWMQIVGYLTPIGWAMEAYGNLIFHDGGLAGVALPVLVLLGMALLFFSLGVWRVKVD